MKSSKTYKLVYQSFMFFMKCPYLLKNETREKGKCLVTVMNVMRWCVDWLVKPQSNCAESTDGCWWLIFFPVAILGNTSRILFFYDEWMVTMVIGSYLWYIAANLQWLHNEYGRMGYVNLTDEQGNLMIVQGAWGRCQGVCRIYQEGQGCLKDGLRLFRSASVLLW